ncbi:MAG: DNA adenine methylase [Oxalobacter formigenes]|nr:DNA adenine methylase [Oxalobacter formigenes]
MKPFLKWAGGKGQLLKEIERYYPFNEGITKYAEPFVGGGAVLFDILGRYDVKEVYISDINAELINTYKVIQNAIDDLVRLLLLYQAEYTPLHSALRRQYYIGKREKFNNLKVNRNEKENIEKAALMIFLNKTCFNGLYRVNRKGFFNVPMGSYKNPLICNENSLRYISEKLQDVTIVCGDYQQSENFIDKYTFVYFDPPYRPITDTADFTAYTELPFDDKAQIELAKFVEKVHQKGARVVVSNSDPKNSNIKDDFFDAIYASHNIKRVEANRMINCNSTARGKIKELLISNY